MKTDEQLRTDIKLAKALKGISYKAASEAINIKQKSFYAWLKGNFSLSYENKYKLEKFLQE